MKSVSKILMLDRPRIAFGNEYINSFLEMERQ